jgi:hypothetical protein
MYSRRDIDKARGRGETWPVDSEMREALDQLGTNLRGEVRSVDAGLREALNQVVVDLRGEVRSGDAGLREALNQVVVDLRGEVRSGDAGLRDAINELAVDLRGEIRSGDAETRAYVDERIQASSAEMRRHFDVVGESLRSDIRAVVEGMAASREQTDRRIDEEARQRGGLEGRVVRLEVRVADLEDGRKPRRARRRPPP